MIDTVWKLIIFESMLNRITKTSGNERVTLRVYNTYPICVRCMHTWSHGRHPGGSIILVTLWSASGVMVSTETAPSEDNRAHFQSLLQHPPHSHSQHLYFTIRMAHRFLQAVKKGLSHLFHSFFWHTWMSCTFPFTKAPLCLKLLIPTPNAVGRWGSLWNCRRKAHWTETTDLCFANCSTQNTFCSRVAIFSL